MTNGASMKILVASSCMVMGEQGLVHPMAQLAHPAISNGAYRNAFMFMFFDIQAIIHVTPVIIVSDQPVVNVMKVNVSF